MNVSVVSATFYALGSLAATRTDNIRDKYSFFILKQHFSKLNIICP